eukprot:SAG31_NODE_8057_length_1531_cov_1.925978_1_plen_153_part_10
MLREQFQYQPTLKVSQFFGNGFVECKIIFVCDIIRLCRTKHASLWKAHKDARAKVALRKYQPNARLQSRNVAPPAHGQRGPVANRGSERQQGRSSREQTGSFGAAQPPEDEEVAFEPGHAPISAALATPYERPALPPQPLPLPLPLPQRLPLP